MKKVSSILMALIMALVLTIPAVAASDFPTGDIEPAVQAYLIKRNDGYMRVVSTGRYSNDGHVDVFGQYYDKNLNFVKNTKIPQELPEFGGFYTDDENYYILSYLDNKSENNNVEVLRITKYDTNWNKISSAGLNHLGMVRLYGEPSWAKIGNVLYVRGAKINFKSNDGLNHQKSIMLALNTNTMKFIDSQNISTGYFSHSVDRAMTSHNGRLINAELGDAYPRAFIVREYEPAADGSCPNSPIYQKELMIPVGKRANGHLGASLSETLATNDYIFISGKIIHQDNEDNQTQNFFVYSVNRQTQEFTIHWFTNMPEGQKSVDNCHIVPVGNDQFIAVWDINGENKVYYQKFDEHAKPIGEVYTMDGGVTMDTPIIDGNDVIWLNAGEGTVTMYHLSIGSMNCEPKVSISKETQETLG